MAEGPGSVMSMLLRVIAKYDPSRHLYRVFRHPSGLLLEKPLPFYSGKFLVSYFIGLQTFYYPVVSSFMYYNQRKISLHYEEWNNNLKGFVQIYADLHSFKLVTGQYPGKLLSQRAYLEVLIWTWRLFPKCQIAPPFYKWAVSVGTWMVHEIFRVFSKECNSIFQLDFMTYCCLASVMSISKWEWIGSRKKVN